MAATTEIPTFYSVRTPNGYVGRGFANHPLGVVSLRRWRYLFADRDEAVTYASRFGGVLVVHGP